MSLPVFLSFSFFFHRLPKPFSGPTGPPLQKEATSHMLGCPADLFAVCLPSDGTYVSTLAVQETECVMRLESPPEMGAVFRVAPPN